MKIDESSIDHNAVRLIEELVSDAYSFCGADDTDKAEEYHIMTLGNICGVLDMAKAMKEVLKA